MESLEKEIMKLEDEQQKLETSLIELAAAGDSRKIQESSQRLGLVKKKIDDSFEELTEVTLEHDERFTQFELKLKDLEV